MSTAYKNCQSCGMPLKKDPKGGGTNADGSRSTMYCSLCYANGKFLQPDWTASQMQSFVREKMKEMGIPGFLAGFFSKGVPRLERWKK
ncbi:MAG: zinc ribbon domain-containing protein [Bacteroidota bacterium]|uniref:zinc ribbon domain-containing protein n=1 Tax=Candidatus Pollutiaquabacter sp. TaxID=3416354 RepID=UPI001A3FE007|nr:zinc ribbon domain-containing protein [Bacteroidota bacterium]MBL7948194.1 zinc ribbon domain-containing protein [Bacteroidia bacterium]MBP7269133.1 zinc ribbon domain-containing protein [Bacteroidia bacterium]MBP7436193.1 zinc ribbon domain-containing protein [Bacteroidia bacterium]MBP7728134.1 zinc ribbon domain-containing protein [Bacteroidia bacterium]